MTANEEWLRLEQRFRELQGAEQIRLCFRHGEPPEFFTDSCCPICSLEAIAGGRHCWSLQGPGAYGRLGQRVNLEACAAGALLLSHPTAVAGGMGRISRADFRWYEWVAKMTSDVEIERCAEVNEDPPLYFPFLACTVPDFLEASAIACRRASLVNDQLPSTLPQSPERELSTATTRPSTEVGSTRRKQKSAAEEERARIRQAWLRSRQPEWGVPQWATHLQVDYKTFSNFHEGIITRQTKNLRGNIARRERIQFSTVPE